MAKKFEPLKVDWRPGMTYEEEQKFFKGFVSELVRRENKRRTPGFFEGFTSHKAADICHGGPEPWQPVYDDIMVSYLDAYERRECEKKGFTREQTVEFAKKKVLDEAWQDCDCRAYHWDPDQRVDNPYENREHFYRKCAEGDLPVSRMMRAVMEKCYFISDGKVNYEYPGWEDLQSEKIGKSLGLRRSETGKQVLDIIKDSHYHRYYRKDLESCEIDNKYKEICLPSNISDSEEVLSLTYAAAVLKQEANGVGISREDIAIRRADALAMQVSVAEEMREEDPKILEKFIEKGNQPVYDAFKQTLDKTNNPDAARSAAVDCYLDAALKGEKPSVEKIASVCKDAKGQSYYIDPKSVAAMAVTKVKETAETNNIFKESVATHVFEAKGKQDQKANTPANRLKAYDEPVFNAAFMAKAKQGGR